MMRATKYFSKCMIETSASSPGHKARARRLSAAVPDENCLKNVIRSNDAFDSLGRWPSVLVVTSRVLPSELSWPQYARSPYYFELDSPRALYRRDEHNGIRSLGLYRSTCQSKPVRLSDQAATVKYIAVALPNPSRNHDCICSHRRLHTTLNTVTCVREPEISPRTTYAVISSPGFS